MLGSGTYVDGLACTQTGPASLQVQVAAGSIYTQVATDTVAYGSLGTDAHMLMKEGLVLDPTTLTLAAPSTSGQSVNYLIQVAYSDLDANNAVLNYFNSANPTVPFVGPMGSGAAQPTTRKGVCVVSLKPGTAASTGTQATPAPDSGYTGLYVITVTYGQTTITNSQITTLATAPFIVNKLGTPPKPTPTLFGLTLSNDVTLPNTVFDIAAGGAIDKTGLLYVKFGTPFTKSFSNFAIGTGNGSLDAGTVASSRWYHVHLIYNATTGLPDILTSLSYATPTLPSGYTYSVPIGALYVNSSGNIMPFVQTGHRFVYGTAAVDNSAFVPGSSPMTITLNVPSGVKLLARYRFTAVNGYSGNVTALALSPDEASTSSSINSGALATLYVPAAGGPSAAADIATITSTGGQIKVSQSVVSAATFYTSTYGFDYPRGA